MVMNCQKLWSSRVFWKLIENQEFWNPGNQKGKQENRETQKKAESPEKKYFRNFRDYAFRQTSDGLSAEMHRISKFENYSFQNFRVSVPILKLWVFSQISELLGFYQFSELYSFWPFTMANALLIENLGLPPLQLLCFITSPNSTSWVKTICCSLIELLQIYSNRCACGSLSYYVEFKSAKAHGQIYWDCRGSATPQTPDFTT